ncbi:nectin-1 isoform X2 [Xenopus laevis]|uniref:Nectin-1 isoform X2 n=1 Tax=Xenopus laevis TaxID=8355 RepID=A0A8J0T6K2_XENLA|nr:nectin-1 isoform X2 [Xenopus laevis]
MLIPWIMAPRRNGHCWYWPLTISVFLASVFQGVHSQMVLVNETVSGYVGEDVMLHCNFVNSPPSVKITQVTWQKSTNGSKQNVAIYNPAMGVSILSPYKERVSFLNPSFRDGTIMLTQLQLEDEGSYICEFATFPTGNRESQLNLTVLAKPVNHMEGTSNQLIAVPGSTKKVAVATCISANGKPPSSLNWETKLKGEPEYQEIKNENGTVTVISRYLLVPNREAHQQPLTCVINYQTERYTQTTLLSVQYEPHVTIEGFDGNWYVRRPEVKLTCTADANPPPSLYEWRMANGSLPDNAIVNNNTLHFRGEVTYGFSGTYICEAKNAIGSRTGQVEVNVTEFPFTPTTPGRLDRRESSTFPTAIVGGAVGGVVLVLAVSVLIFVVLRKRHQTFKGDYNTKKHVYGNGYSKAGVAQHPPMAQSLQYPEDSDDEKKPGPVGSSIYEEEDDEGLDRHKLAQKFDDESKRPYFTVEEGERRCYNEDRTLGFQYEPDDMPDNLVPQNDGSFISKKEWYV